MRDMMILAVFRSRTHSLDYAEKVRSYGVTAETVSAPKEAKIGCGLCVRMDERVFVRAQAILKRKKYSTFRGFFRQEFKEGRMRITPYKS